MGRQVGGRDPAPGRREPGRLAGGELAGIEVPGARRREPPQRCREGGEPDPLARVPGTAVGPVGHGPAAGAGAQLAVEQRAGSLDRPHELVVGGEAAAGELDRRREEVCPRQPPEAGMGVAPRADGAGTVIARGPRRGSVARPPGPQGGGVRRRRGSPGAVERDRPAAASSQMSQKASPPIPQASPKTTASTAFVAIAASTALPPARRIPRPAAVAR